MVKICQLLLGVDSDQTEMTVLDRLLGEVLADVNVLRPLTAADDGVVAPFNARVVVLVDRRSCLRCESHILQEVSEVNYFNSRRGC